MRPTSKTADLNGDGRLDIVLNVVERSDSYASFVSGLGWLEQPSELNQPWLFHRIGNTLPDWVIGIHLADIDGDGDLDAVTGGYSGVNVLAGTYSGASRDFDSPEVDSASSVARLAWFETPASPSRSGNVTTSRVVCEDCMICSKASTWMETATWILLRREEIAESSMVPFGSNKSEVRKSVKVLRPRDCWKANTLVCHPRIGRICIPPTPPTLRQTSNSCPLQRGGC